MINSPWVKFKTLLNVLITENMDKIKTHTEVTVYMWTHMFSQYLVLRYVCNITVVIELEFCCAGLETAVAQSLPSKWQYSSSICLSAVYLSVEASSSILPDSSRTLIGLKCLLFARNSKRDPPKKGTKNYFSKWGCKEREKCTTDWEKRNLGQQTTGKMSHFTDSQIFVLLELVLVGQTYKIQRQMAWIKIFLKNKWKHRWKEGAEVPNSSFRGV